VVSDGGYGQPRNQLIIQSQQQNQQQMMMNDQYNNYQPNMTTVPVVHVQQQQPSQSISVIVPNGTSPGCEIDIM